MNYDEIIGFAKEKHGNQKRRGGELYFYHVKEVGELAKEIAYQMSDKYHFTEEEIELMQYAGFLHDTIEDTNTNYDHIMNITNEKVAGWIAVLSNDKRLPKVLRREIYNNGIKNACIQIKIIKLADIYSNLIGIRGNEGEEWIAAFKLKAQNMLECLRAELSDNLYYKKCEDIIRA